MGPPPAETDVYAAALQRTSSAWRVRVLHIGWYDEVMDACHWFSLNIVEPVDAAMLLCQLNPQRDCGI